MSGLTDALKTSLSVAAKDVNGMDVPIVKRFLPAVTAVVGVAVMVATFFGYAPATPQAAAMGEIFVGAAMLYIRHLGDPAQ